MLWRRTIILDTLCVTSHCLLVVMALGLFLDAYEFTYSHLEIDLDPQHIIAIFPFKVVNTTDTMHKIFANKHSLLPV